MPAVVTDQEHPDGASVEDPAAQTQTVGQAVRRYAPRVLSATGGLAVVAYVVLRIAAGDFYARFGVSPEDVGIGQADLLARSAGIAVIALLIAVLVAVGFALIAEVVRLRSRERRRGCLVSFLVCALGGLLYSVLRPISETAGTIAVDVLVWAAVLGLALGVVLRVWREPARGPVLYAFAAAFALSAGLSVAVLFVTASTGRRVVSRGEGISDWAEPWQATVVTLESVDPGAVPPNVARLPCGVYLGSGSGKAIVVDPVNHETLWIPADRVILRSYLRVGSAEPVCTRNGVHFKKTS